MNTITNNTIGNIALSNVQSLNNNTAYNVIYNFMEKNKKNSENTYDSYQRYYNEFFRFVIGKDLWSVTWDDILRITYTDVENYQIHMLNEKGWKENTCNQKLFAVKKLWDTLNRHNNNVNLGVLNFEELNAEDNSYASLTTEEVDSLIEFAKTNTKSKAKGIIQSGVFEFLYIVGCRKEVPFDLTRDMITRCFDFQAQKEVWVIKFKDKGKIVQKGINDDYYDRLIALSEMGKDKNKIFNVSMKTVENTFDSFRAKYNLYEKNGKKVVIHSIKKASGWSVYNTTGGDMQKTKDHMQHESMELTSKTYLDSKNNFSSQGSYLLSREVSIDMLSELSQEDLLMVINKCGKDILNRVHYEAENMGLI